jgi:TolB-like protein
MRISFDNFVLDTDRCELRGTAGVIHVEPQVFDLLLFFVRNPNRVISKDELIDQVWKGRIVSDSALNSRINSARKAIGESGENQRLIKTVQRRGFLFVGEGAISSAGQGPGAKAVTRSEPPNLTLPDKPSITVLPFQNLSGDPEQEYFADGVVEEIITGLSRIKWLFVIARNSSFAYKGRTLDVKQIGRELGVRYVMQGSLRKAAKRVRISAQLIEAETGLHLWAERFDRHLDDIFALQDEITLSVVGAIEPSLRLAEAERVKRKRPDNLDAYDLLLQAQTYVYTRMPEPSTQALALLERALALDPNYALAHAYAAECYHALFLRGGLHESDRIASVQHAEAAIKHGQDDALALAFAGFVIGMDKHDRPAAFAALEASLAVSPSSAHAYIQGSVILAFAGESERAIEWAERGIRLSPLDPWRSSALFAIAIAHFHRGRYEEATIAARKSVQFSPGFSMSHMALAASSAKLGQIEEARSAAERVLQLQPLFRYRQQFVGGNFDPNLAASMGEALRISGLPE